MAICYGDDNLFAGDADTIGKAGAIEQAGGDFGHAGPEDFLDGLISGLALPIEETLR